MIKYLTYDLSREMTSIFIPPSAETNNKKFYAQETVLIYLESLHQLTLGVELVP